jgi:hypothetical protein
VKGQGHYIIILFLVKKLCTIFFLNLTFFFCLNAAVLGEVNGRGLLTGRGIIVKTFVGELDSLEQNVGVGLPWMHLTDVLLFLSKQKTHSVFGLYAPTYLLCTEV